jgi:alpha-mannosidase
LLREAELWAATAAVRTGAPYPYDELTRIWRMVLLNQFHDILPGSSIAWVHRQAETEYAEIAADLERIIGTAIAALVDPDADRTTSFNAAPHTRDGVPALAAGVPAAVSAPTVLSADNDGWMLDNGLLRAHVDARGLLTSVRDLLADREVLAPGSGGNLLQLHQDLPTEYDAWNVDASYRHTVSDLVDVRSVDAAVVDGNATLSVTRAFGSSTVRQTVALRPGVARIDMTVDVDWHETEKLLKVAFPLDIRAESSAAETQFGHILRPTHRNTSWDAARFEICAHRFLHVAEPGYGLALVNDSTYGHDVTRDVREDGGTTTTVRLSLLRAPRSPDPHTDQGEHRMRYALVPGASIVDAVREGYALNLPLRAVRGRSSFHPLLSIDDPRVVIEAVKLAEDRSGDLIVRLYEASGGRTSARLTPDLDLIQAERVDLLERPLADGHARERDADGRVILGLRPFEIVTLRMRRPEPG